MHDYIRGFTSQFTPLLMLGRYTHQCPDTKGPIELYMQYRILSHGYGGQESSILVDELLNPLTDENGNEFMK